MDTDKARENVVTTPGGPRPEDAVRAVRCDQTVVHTDSGIIEIVSDHSATGHEGNSQLSPILVVTPGGYRPQSQVHYIEPGHIVDCSAGAMKKFDSNGRTVADLGTPTTRASGTPLMPSSVVSPPAAPPAMGSGWIVYGFWNNVSGRPITQFRTTWIVPPPPSSQSGQLIYLFNGIQNSTMILQPVLQWGTSPIGGGNFWAAASWYVDGQNGPALHSDFVRVSPGDVLVGVMTLTATAGGTFNYNCVFQGIPNTARKYPECSAIDMVRKHWKHMA